MKTTASKTQTPAPAALRHEVSRGLVTLLVLLLGGLFSLSAGVAAEVSSEELAIFNFMKNSAGQHRASVTLDPILCKVAHARAADLAARGYFAHVNPDGYAANYLVRQAGYVLPDGYSTAPGANNLESIAAGRSSASATWSDWMGSPPHRQHLLGEASFFAEQTSVGVGYVNIPGSQYQWYWVVITAPPSGPQLLITSPKAGSEVNDPFVTVTGTTGGEPKATSVQVRVENANGEGAWVAAEGAASWTANVDGLLPGANALRVQTLSDTGAVLREMVRNVRYIVLAPLTVDLNGTGSVTKGFAGTTMREVGRNYTITATAQAGLVFAGWTGGVTSLQRTITFTVPEAGMTLTASFIPNPFTAGVGAYSTLFTGTDGTHGALSVSLSRNGSFTGKLRLGRETVVLKGRFDIAGAAQVTVTSPSGATYTLALHYANTDGAITLGGTISGTGWSADVALDTLAKSNTRKNAHAGRYTLVIPAPTEATADKPAGDGVATINVDNTGAATLAGALADGTPFTVRARVTTAGTLQVFAPLYASQGLLTGTLDLHAHEVSDLDGTLFWSRPAQVSAPNFAAGFTIESNAVGSRYTAPTTNEPLVPVSSGENNASLALGDGGLSAPVVQPATLTPSNMLTISAPAVSGITAKINPTSGSFSGKFVHPQTGALTSFRGVILQKQGAGFGFFAGGADAGYATFAPAESAALLAKP